MSAKLILLRHGQSLWNKQNLFTGWVDVDLSEQGEAEAIQAGKELAGAGIEIDLAFTSVLKRAIRTLWICLQGMDQMWVPISTDWRLNERHYGALQGLNKTETAEKYGADQIKIWRRSYSVLPPPLASDSAEHPRHDRRYAHIPTADLPSSESLETTLTRVIPYWERAILPGVQANKTILIAAHGNSLRALLKHLNQISDEDITELNIPTGVPLVLELDDQQRVLSQNYLGDQKAIQAAADAVAKQGQK